MPRSDRDVSGDGLSIASRPLEDSSGIECSVIDPGVENISIRSCGRLERIDRSLPAEGDSGLAFFGWLGVEHRAEGVHWQRLYFIRAAVPCAEILQDSFVDGSADEETETRIQTELHVSEILVGKELDKEGRHRGGPGFAVGPVPKASSAPLGIAGAPDVLDDLSLDKVRITPCLQPAFSVREKIAVLAFQCVDGESPDYRVVRAYSRVGVEGQGKVHGNAQTFRIRVRSRTSGHPSDPGSPPGIVPQIVTFLHGKQGCVRSGPLHPVDCALAERRHPRR